MFCSNNCKKLVLIKMGCWAAQSAAGRHTVLYVRLGDHRPYVVGADRKAHGGGGEEGRGAGVDLGAVWLTAEKQPRKRAGLE